MRNFKYNVGDKVVCSIFAEGQAKGEVIFVDVEAGVDDQLVYSVKMEDNGLDCWVAESNTGSDYWYIVGPAEDEPDYDEYAES